MSGAEPTLAESPVPLALSRLQGVKSPGRMSHGGRGHRPSLPLASLQEAVDETPRRFSDEPSTPHSDDEEMLSNFEKIKSPSKNGRRASDAAFAERYRKLTDFDETPPVVDMSRRASVAVTPAAERVRSPPLNADKGRRRSWAAKLQLERKKRRKSGGNDTDDESDTAMYVRQKRPSWWNVFVPENVLKNR